MKKSTVIVLFALQFMLFAAAGGCIFLFGQYNLAAANARAAASEERAAAVEKQAATLNERVCAEIQLNEVRSRETVRLKSLTGALQKEVAELKDSAKSSHETTAQNRFVIGGRDGPGLQLGAEIPPEILKQLGNIQIGPGVAGTITINGEKVQLGDADRLQEHAIKIILNELQLGDPAKPPAEKKEKTTDEQF